MRSLQGLCFLMLVLAVAAKPSSKQPLGSIGLSAPQSSASLPMGDGNVDHRPCQLLLWPLPQNLTQGSKMLQVDLDAFSVTFHGLLGTKWPSVIRGRLMDGIPHLHVNGHARHAADDLEINSSLYLPSPAACLGVWATNRTHVGSFSSLSISVTDGDAPLSPSTDESYSMVLQDDSLGGSVITAATPYGALHAAETLLQLIYVYHNVDGSRELGLLPQTPITVTDAPRFSHRGILVDTSRQYLSLDTIKANVDYMSQVKMNVMHWHISDSESFPIELESVPELTRLGSYGTEGKGIYTNDDVSEIISYAADKGVRVIPEIDTPAHAYAWSYAYPELVTCPDMQPNWEQFCGGPPCGQLDPTQSQTYDVVHSIMKDLGNLFADDYMHLGYDEVNGDCWLTSKNVRSFMSAHNYTDWSQLLQYYLDQQMTGLPSDRVPVFWEDVVDDGLIVPSNAVIQVWSTTATLASMLESTDLSFVLSNSDAWYLDCGAGNWVTGAASWCNYATWQDVYLNEPFQDVDGPVPQDYLDRTLGGEVCVWGDKISDANQLPAAWPRAAAAAERLWSARNVNDTASALPRLLTQATRFGPSVEALTPFWCLYNPDSCLDPIQLRPPRNK